MLCRVLLICSNLHVNTFHQQNDSCTRQVTFLNALFTHNDGSQFFCTNVQYSYLWEPWGYLKTHQLMCNNRIYSGCVNYMSCDHTASLHATACFARLRWRITNVAPSCCCGSQWNVTLCIVSSSRKFWSWQYQLCQRNVALYITSCYQRNIALCFQCGSEMLLPNHVSVCMASLGWIITKVDNFHASVGQYIRAISP